MKLFTFQVKVRKIYGTSQKLKSDRGSQLVALVRAVHCKQKQKRIMRTARNYVSAGFTHFAEQGKCRLLLQANVAVVGDASWSVHFHWLLLVSTEYSFAVSFTLQDF